MVIGQLVTHPVPVPVSLHHLMGTQQTKRLRDGRSLQPGSRSEIGHADRSGPADGHEQRETTRVAEQGKAIGPNLDQRAVAHRGTTLPTTVNIVHTAPERGSL